MMALILHGSELFHPIADSFWMEKLSAILNFLFGFEDCSFFIKYGFSFQSRNDSIMQMI